MPDFLNLTNCIVCGGVWVVFGLIMGAYSYATATEDPNEKFQKEIKNDR
jgi:hypothetical protein